MPPHLPRLPRWSITSIGWGARVLSDRANATGRRERITAAGKAITQHEKHLVEVMLNGVGGRKGLADMPEIFIIGGRNDKREGLVSLAVQGVPSARVVSELSDNGVRVHIRKNDYFFREYFDSAESGELRASVDVPLQYCG